MSPLLRFLWRLRLSLAVARARGSDLARTPDLSREQFECQFEASKAATADGTPTEIPEAKRDELETPLPGSEGLVAIMGSLRSQCASECPKRPMLFARFCRPLANVEAGPRLAPAAVPQSCEMFSCPDHRGAVRVLDLEPVPRRSRPVGRCVPF
jgi:hypothetical protein